MKQFIFAAAAALVATAALAQQPPAPAPATPNASDPTKVAVAVINGEIISQAKLDALYANLTPQMRDRYDQNGGKGAFLDNYMRKRLLVQEAMKSGFDQKPDVQLAMDSAKESVLFDRYVRDVVGAPFTGEADMHKFYEDHLADFATPEKRHIYHLVLATTGAKAMSPAEAAQKIAELNVNLREQIAKSGVTDPAKLKDLTLTLFKRLAQQYSMDGSAPKGGDLGYLTRGNLEASFESAAWSTPNGTVSAPVKSAWGYHLIFIDDVIPAGTEPFESVKADIREKLLTDHTTDIMNAVSQLTNELKKTGKVSITTANIK